MSPSQEAYDILRDLEYLIDELHEIVNGKNHTTEQAAEKLHGIKIAIGYA